MFTKHVDRQLAAYCHGELTGEETRRVAEHLQRCPRCRAECETLQFAARLVSTLPAVPAPASLWSRMEAALEHGAESPARWAAFLWPAPASGWRALPAFGVCLLLLLGIAVGWVSARSTGPGWEVLHLAGAPYAGAAPVRASSRLRVGEWLETDARSRARIDVADIGEVEIEPNTRIRLVRSRAEEHRLRLARGTLRAQIYAPPRLFFVDTPSAVAVDLGCAYTLAVDPAGRGLLRVSSGWVAFVRHGRESIVPAGAACETRPVLGPGTPYFDDAPQPLRAALTKFDFEQGGAPMIALVLAAARPRDTLTLWHLLARVSSAERAQVYDRLAALAPPPAGVSRAGILSLDEEMLSSWKAKVEDSWWQ